jgi:hypothetical protein
MVQVTQVRDVPGVPFDEGLEIGPVPLAEPPRVTTPCLGVPPLNETSSEILWLRLTGAHLWPERARKKMSEEAARLPLFLGFCKRMEADDLHTARERLADRREEQKIR